MVQFSDTVSELFAALHEFQAEATAVAKDGHNPHFGNTFASLNKIIETTRPLLTKHGLVVTQFPDEDSLTTILAHTSGEFIVASASLANISDPQKQGGSITYMRRYAYGAVLGLITEEDDDANAATAASTPREKKTPARSLVNKGVKNWGNQT